MAPDAVKEKDSEEASDAALLPRVQNPSRRGSVEPTGAQAVAALPPIKIEMIYPPHLNAPQAATSNSHFAIPDSDPIPFSSETTPYPLINDFLDELDTRFTGTDSRHFWLYKGKFADEEYIRINELGTAEILGSTQFFEKEIGMKKGTAGVFLKQLKIRLQELKTQRSTEASLA